MANGKTLEMIVFSRQKFWRTVEFQKTERDRSLNGKKRIKARRAKRRKEKDIQAG